MSKHECCKEDGSGCCNEHKKCNWWKCIGWGVLGIVGFAAIALLFGWVIMLLWNWLMPSLFQLPIITYCQAIGLAVLSRLLFGGCGKGMRHFKYKFHKHHGCKCCGGSCKCNCCNDNNKDCCSNGDKKDECCKKDDSTTA